ncbi:TM2 domain-containing protein [Chitinimonas viridis]|uniref:TM2 domain-containing protein n=1 Tax=Chitinimonas viridis TaxID=664880 RepID=A0ABT8B710_9NEIS|nr:TM2 domain-containing protein [Chitinimonas viridis]MDN3577520.1 TM2 domain-containing protein [Chitinimonas viridis]
MSDKNRSLALILCLLFGWVGAHRFYAGRTISAVIQLLTLGGLCIWAMIDLLIILFGEFKDSNELKIADWKMD